LTSTDLEYIPPTANNVKIESPILKNKENNITESDEKIDTSYNTAASISP
jgi:hypothetical protein